MSKANPLSDTFVLATSSVESGLDGSTSERTYVTYNGQTIGGELYGPPRDNRRLIAWLNANKADLAKALGVPPFDFARDR